MDIIYLAFLGPKRKFPRSSKRKKLFLFFLLHGLVAISIASKYFYLKLCILLKYNYFKLCNLITIVLTIRNLELHSRGVKVRREIQER